MRGLFYFASGLMILILGGCVKTPVESPDQYPAVKDLLDFPQHARAYIENIHSHEELLPVQKQYETKYFEPWNYTQPPFSKEEILWPFESYTYTESFGENLLPLDEAWFTNMLEKGNYDKYGTLNKKAVSLHYLNLRNFPTHKPVFKDPNLAGEGFPFDYMQNSGIHANEPLYVSHLSRDGEWAYVFTAYATGWVRLKDIVYVNEHVAATWQNAQHIELIAEGYPIKDLDENFVFRSRIGMRLALISIEPTYYIALAITEGKEHTPVYTKVKVPFLTAKKRTMKINADNLTYVADLMLQNKYGWGGLYEERDCSSMIRDMYAPFGIWLPRNSSQQSKVGKLISFDGLGEEEKKHLILKEAIPFETLLYKKGHILLYIGTHKGRIAVLHNAWGIRTVHNEKEGRRIIGRAIISSLHLGEDQPYYDKENDILAKLESMNIITQQ